MRQPKQRILAQGLDLKDQVISINRVTKVVKGGKNMSFAALVIVGDEGGHVGFGTGKAREVPLAIKKGIEAAKKNLIRVPLINNTLPHQLIGKFGAGRVMVKPASEGTGVIAGGAVRAVMQAVGVRDVRTPKTDVHFDTRYPKQAHPAGDFGVVMKRGNADLVRRWQTGADGVRVMPDVPGGRARKRTGNERRSRDEARTVRRDASSRSHPVVPVLD